MQVIPDHPVNTDLNLLRGPAELSTTAAGVWCRERQLFRACAEACFGASFRCGGKAELLILVMFSYTMSGKLQAENR
jgi:hypothetical protein